MNERDPYPKPASAREAAKYLIRSAIDRGLTPEQLRDGGYGLYRPDYNAVVGRLCGANPPRQIRPDEIGVIGFDTRHHGAVFPIVALWEEVVADAAETPRQATLFDRER